MATKYNCYTRDDNYYRELDEGETIESVQGVILARHEKWIAYTVPGYRYDYQKGENTYCEFVACANGGAIYTLPDFVAIEGASRSPKWDTQVMLRNADFVVNAKNAFAEYKAKRIGKPVDNGGSNETEYTPSDSAPQVTPVGTALETLFANAVASASAEQMFDTIKEKMDTFIAAEYGALPKRIVIDTNGVEIEKQGVYHTQFDNVLRFVTLGVPVYLAGDAGTGKSHLAEQVADALDLEFYFTNAVQDVYSLKGFIDATGSYQATPFYHFCKDGGVFFFDELDGSVAEAVVWLHSALANGYADFPHGRVTLHENCRFIAGGNTAGTGADSRYSARTQLDGATMNRWSVVTIDYDKTIENTMARGNQFIADFARSFRAACVKCGIDHIVSPRNIDYASRVYGQMDMTDIIRFVMTKHLADDDLKIIVNEMRGVGEENEMFLTLKNMVFGH